MSERLCVCALIGPSVNRYTLLFHFSNTFQYREFILIPIIPHFILIIIFSSVTFDFLILIAYQKKQCEHLENAKIHTIFLLLFFVLVVIVVRR